ncbi:MAG TPA: acyl-CoA synthetase [Pseudomonadales bacterium]|nr:acyl-CoA synthetase [Pseudomonadales bacterium]
MLHPYFHAQSRPDQAAIIMSATGETITYQQLDQRSCQAAQLFRHQGLARGSHIAFLFDNHPRFFEVVWGAQRAGLYYTPISYYLQPDEIEYIINNCGAKILVVAAKFADKVRPILSRLPDVKAVYAVDESFDDLPRWEDEIAKMPAEPIADESEGREMLYSSGTTGRPKGIKFPLSDGGLGEPQDIVRSVGLAQFMGVNNDTIALSTSPLYHSAPLGFVVGCHRLGATVVIMEKFDEEKTLQLIEKYKVSYSQWVPTMFVRLLKLPEDVRNKYDVSSMKLAIHGAAPCPMEVKEKIIQWWGPVLWEFYSGSERNGIFMISSPEWLAHKGSVGKCVDAQVHIVDDETGEELPVGQIGTIYCSKGMQFDYHGDAEKKKSITIRDGWTTIGDVGYLDADGYLYLTDRKSYMIISGGVNVYPQETEDCLVTHPKVFDVAVFGVPHEEMGEEVKAVVQPANWDDAGPALEKELIDYCRSKISAIKCPRSIDFERELPREETGKLKKRLIKDRYWQSGKAIN